MTHELKIWPEFFELVESGKKSFEVRNNDRDFRVGDKLVLEEYDPFEREYTGRTVTKKISYILADPRFCKDGIVILGMEEEERKRGRWEIIGEGDSYGNAWHLCSNCGNGDRHYVLANVPYCWKCGTKMEERTMKEIDEIVREADRLGLTYGKYVLKMEQERNRKEQKEKKAQKVKLKKGRARETEKVTVPISVPISAAISVPIKKNGKLKNGWSVAMVESWRDVRRMFGKNKGGSD